MTEVSLRLRLTALLMGAVLLAWVVHAALVFWPLPDLLQLARRVLKWTVQAPTPNSGLALGLTLALMLPLLWWAATVAVLPLTRLLRALQGAVLSYGEGDYSLSIRATALAQSGQAQAASQLRCEQIRAGSRHPAFYNAEADYQLSMGEKDEAQRCLDQVNRLGIGDDVTRALQVKLNQHR